jgi:hypothetical protein
MDKKVGFNIGCVSGHAHKVLENPFSPPVATFFIRLGRPDDFESKMGIRCVNEFHAFT